MKQFFKKLINAFGGSALYLDKKILRHIGVNPKDEVVITLVDKVAVISKPLLSTQDIDRILSKLESNK